VATTTVLGVDPGLTRCGIGVVRGPSARPTLVAAEVVRTPAGDAIESRLLALLTALRGIIRLHEPDVVAVERVLFNANTRTAMATGQAAGVALIAAAEAGLAVRAYGPTEVKSTVAGDGGADKAAVAQLVAAQLRLAAPPTPVDVTDALAVALTDLARGRVTALAVGTSAAGALADAHRAAARAARGGWEAVLGERVTGGAA
jgi:crossover junction endodeoxyribonuclease RuvC